jgi:hypothetical protein
MQDKDGILTCLGWQVVELLQAPCFLDFLSKGFGHFGGCLGEMVKMEW